MNAERLLAHFETISEAPDAVARLRRFILDMAVRGKLVEQDPEDPLPEQTLDDLRNQKDFAYAVEDLRARKPITPIQRNELWFGIPHCWMLCSFDDAFVIVSGVAKGQRIPAGDISLEVPYLRVANVQRGWLNLAEVKSIAVRQSDIDRYRLAELDILMTEGGDWDKLGRAAIWRGEIEYCIHQNHIFRLRIPSDSILPQWVVLYVNSDCGRRFFEDSSKQTTNLASINLTQLRACPLPLPPLAEQHRIVAKVDELMVLCDQLEAARQQREQHRERLVAASLQRLNQPSEDPASFRNDARFALQVLPSLTTTPAQIKQLRQTILNLAVRGKLLVQDPEDEPAEEWLRTLSLHCTLDSRKSRRIQQDSDNNHLITLPRGWVLTPFYKIARVKSNLVDPARHPDEPHIAPDCIESWTGRLLGFQTVGESGVTSPKHLFNPGVILYSKIRPNLAKAIKADFGGLCSADMYPIEPLIDRDFLLKYMISTLFVEQATAGDNRVAMPKINQAALNQILVPLPPLAEQHRIVAKVDELMTFCDQLEQQLSQADQQRRRLLEALLAEALNGRLDAEGMSHADAA